MRSTDQRLADLEARVNALTLVVEGTRDGAGRVTSPGLRQVVHDHTERFDTLQTSLLRRIWFRVDGWPGQRNLNASGRRWRPWHRGRA